MAEFITHEEAHDMFGSKGKTNAALTLGIIGTALGAGVLGNNNGGCCGNNNGGILGNLLGGNNNGCCCAMKEAQNAKTMAMLQGQQADNLAWANRVAAMEYTSQLANNIEPRLTQMNNQDWRNRVKSLQDDFEVYANLSDRNAKTNLEIANQSQLLTNQIWDTRTKSLTGDFEVYSSLNNKVADTNLELANQVQLLTNQSWMRREEDLKEKTDIYVRGMQADQALAAQTAKDKFDLYKMSNDADNFLDGKFTRISYESRIDDLKEKNAMYANLSSRISELEKAQAKTETALPLMFELTKVKAEKYTDDCCCASKVNLLNTANGLQRQIDHKLDGQLKYSYNDLCAPVPSISPLYCTPFTTNGSGTTWYGNYNNRDCNCQSL